MAAHERISREEVVDPAVPPELKVDLLRLPVEQVFESLGSSVEGLTSEEASRRLEIHGRNEFAKGKRLTSLEKLVRLIGNPLVIILMFAGAVSGFFGELVNAAIIFSIVLMSMFLLVYQESKAQTAADELKERVAVTATVLRDGMKKEVKISEIVPGDIFYLSTGDIVPADARVIESNDLEIDQSALTGESFPVEKSAQTASPERQIAEFPNCLLLGTSATSGHAIAVVIETGNATEYGKIAAKLVARQPETEFERGMRRFGFLIMQVTILLVMFVFFVNALYKHGILESLLFSVALAVGLTPELLPMIISVNLAKGAVAMAKKGVIVKRLNAIQNFGSMDVLCTDKTGTLTENKISLWGSLDPFGADSSKVLSVCFVNSHFQSGMKSPLDEAIIRAREPGAIDYQLIDEISFDFVRKRISVVVDRQDRRLIITKGAPEEVLRICSNYEASGQTTVMSKDTQQKIAQEHHRLGMQGLRTLGVAYRETSRDLQRTSYAVTDEGDMIFLGFLSFTDPPKKEAGESLQLLRTSNVELKVLTGDDELVARNVCEQLGFKVRRVVVGRDIDHMQDDALARTVEKANVFARVTPTQKNRIISTLRNNGHVVGFLGDGINDAPSLKSADVGISVDNAVDVAKESADIILSKKSLKLLHDGVNEGRRTFGNTMKYVMMGISSNFGNMFSVAGASLILPFLPMLPTQILLNNLMYDISESTIPTDNVDEDYLDQPKRLDIKYIRDFMILFGLISSIFDFLTFFLMLYVFHAGESLFQTAWFLESFCTESLVIFVIRTRRIPFYKSRPSRPLLLSTVGLVCIALVLPLTPLAVAFGFVQPPLLFFGALALYAVVYLGLVELAKRWFYRHHAATEGLPYRRSR